MSAVRRAHVVVFLMVGLVGVLVGVGYVWSRPITYRAEAVVAVLPSRSGAVDGARTPAGLASLVASGYVPYLSSSVALQPVARATRVPLPELARTTMVTLQPGTSNVVIDVAAPTRERAVARANALAGVATGRGDLGDVRVDLVSAAAERGTTASPRPWPATAAAVALALFLAALTAAALPPGPRAPGPAAGGRGSAGGGAKAAGAVAGLAGGTG